MNFTLIGNVELILAVIPALISVGVFARVRWWKSRWGIHLMAYMAAIALVLVLACVRLMFADTVWFATARAASFAAVVIVLWWRMFYIIQAAHEGSPNESPVSDEKQKR